MPLEPEIPFAVVPLTIIAGLLSLFYSLYGAVMTFFRIGNTSLHGWGDIYALVFMSLPLLAFPIFLSSLFSLKTCRNWFSAYRDIYLTPPCTTGCGLTRVAKGTGSVCTACCASR